MSATDKLVHRVRPADGDPAGGLVLLHGRGADEHDLLPLFDRLDPDRRLLGVTPRGPLNLPPGGAHWYAVAQVGYPDPATFRPSCARLSGWLDAFLAAHGLAPERTIIGGFSQGAVMSYAVSLGAGRPRPAGVIALSGFIPTVEGFDLNLDEKAAGMPVAIGHGVLDPVIGVQFGRDARDTLTAAEADVTYEETQMAHSIDPRFLATLPAWVERATSSAA